jgi:hypothetical protein
VNKNTTPVQPMPLSAMRRGQRVMFAVVNNGSTGVSEIRYSVPWAEAVNLELFNMKGALVQNLANGLREPGFTYSIALGNNISGISVKPGAYIVKLAAPGSIEAGMVVVK